MSLLMPDPTTLYTLSVQQGTRNQNTNSGSPVPQNQQHQDDSEQSEDLENPQQIVQNARTARRRARRQQELGSEFYFMNIFFGTMYACAVVFFLILALGKVGESRKWINQDLPMLSPQSSKTVVNCALTNNTTNNNVCIQNVDDLENVCSTIELPKNSDDFWLYGDWPKAGNSIKDVLDIFLVILLFGGVIVGLFKDFFLVFFLFTFTFRVGLSGSSRKFLIRMFHVTILTLCLFLIETMGLGIFGFSILSNQKSGNIYNQRLCSLQSKNLPGEPDECMYAYWQCDVDEKTYIFLDQYWWHIFFSIQAAITLIILLIFRIVGRVFSMEPSDENQVQHQRQQGILSWYVGGNQNNQHQRQQQQQQQQNQIGEVLIQEQNSQQGQRQVRRELQMQQIRQLENQSSPNIRQEQGYSQQGQEIERIYYPNPPGGDQQDQTPEIFQSNVIQSDFQQQQIEVSEVPQHVQNQLVQQHILMQSIASSSRNDDNQEINHSGQRVSRENNYGQDQQLDNYVASREYNYSDQQVEGAQQNGQMQNVERQRIFTFSFVVNWAIRIILLVWFGALGYYAIASGFIIMTQDIQHAAIVLGKCCLMGTFLIFSYEP